jgi:starch synthase
MCPLGFCKIGKIQFSFNVLKETTDKLGFELYLIEIPIIREEERVYGYEDDIERFLSFQIAG